MVRKGSPIRRTRGDAVFDVLNTVFMGFFLLLMLYPLYFVIVISVSDINQVALGRTFLWPSGFTLDAYHNLFANERIWTGYRNSIIYTVGSTVYTLALMLPLAYALSKRNLFGKSVISWFLLFTMFFSGGIIPSYLLMKGLGLVNSPMVMIVGSLSVYNLTVTRTFYATAIPGELYESAKIDGASEFRCFTAIALPLSGAITAVMALYTAVSNWNSFFSALIYLGSKPELHPLQMVLRSILILGEQLSNARNFYDFSMDEQKRLLEQARIAEGIKYAVIFIGSAPLLIAYPFIQRYFVKGVMIGSIKG